MHSCPTAWPVTTSTTRCSSPAGYRIPRQPDELLLDENAAAMTGAEVGDVIPALTFDVGVIMEVSAEFEESGREPTQADFDEVFTPVEMEVVGIGRTSAAVLTNEAVVGEPTALLSPAFLEEYPGAASYTAAMVELTDPASVGDYVTAVRDELPGLDVGLVDQASLQTSFAAAVRPYWLALTFFALVFGVGALLAVGPAVVRTVDDELVERSTLRALGATRRQLVVAGLVRAALITVGAIAVGSVLAVATSARFPIGPARAAEPASGTEVHVAGLVVAGAVLLLAVGAAAAIRAAALTRRPAARTRRPSALVAPAPARSASRRRPSPASTLRSVTVRSGVVGARRRSVSRSRRPSRSARWGSGRVSPGWSTIPSASGGTGTSCSRTTTSRSMTRPSPSFARTRTSPASCRSLAAASPSTARRCRLSAWSWVQGVRSRRSCSRAGHLPSRGTSCWERSPPASSVSAWVTESSETRRGDDPSHSRSSGSP